MMENEFRGMYELFVLGWIMVVFSVYVLLCGIKPKWFEKEYMDGETFMVVFIVALFGHFAILFLPIAAPIAILYGIGRGIRYMMNMKKIQKKVDMSE